MLNVVREDGAPPWGKTLVSEIAARGSTLYRSEDGWEGNELLHVRAQGFAACPNIADLNRRPAEARTYLLSLRAHTPRCAGGRGDCG